MKHECDSRKENSVKKKNVKSYHSLKSKMFPVNEVNGKIPGRKFNCPVFEKSVHSVRLCEKFLPMSSHERKSIVKKIRYCSNCLGFDHIDSKCTSAKTCFHCGERHHSLLHETVTENLNKNVAHAASVKGDFAGKRNMNSYQVLLATAIVLVSDGSGEFLPFRALIDQGSEVSFITESACQFLGLHRSSVRATINGIGNSVDQAKFVTSIEIRSQYHREFHISIEALVLNKITNFLPSSEIKNEQWKHLANLNLADPLYYQKNKIDLILGSDVFGQIIMEGLQVGVEGEPIAQQTYFGWVLSGKVFSDIERKITVTSMHTLFTLESLMKNFMTVESLEDESSMSIEEQLSEEFFKRTHRRNDEGRFITRLPFKFYFDKEAVLGRSREIAVKRFLQLERKFELNPKLKEEYSKSINEYLTTNRMQLTTSQELVDENSVCNSAYLPHHAVIRESSTSTKMRIVFDASRKTSNGKSLNEILVVGPTIQSDLVTIIINWRFKKVGFITDVQKMYLQIMVDDRDIDYQRIVWRNNSSEGIQDYSLNRLTFGTSSAAYVAIKSMMQLATDEMSKYPEAANVILKDVYVDDVISGGDDVDSVCELQRDLMTMMQSGGFCLKKWASNKNEVLLQIPEDDREVEIPVELNADATIKALGISWNTSIDSFVFKASMDENMKSQKTTRRTVLSTAAKLFDPIGLVAPIVVVAKIFMKKVWIIALDWDDELPVEMCDEWFKYLDELKSISEIKIPRWIGASGNNESYELHGFCDA